MGIMERKLLDLGIDLPNPPKPSGVYLPATTVGNLVYTSGTGCKVNGKVLFQGQVGKELSIEEGQMAARLAALNLLSILSEHLGTLDRIKKIVKVLGFVNCPVGFSEQPKVINGASELFEEVFGDQGKHTRSAIGTNALPHNMPVELEMIVELNELA
ncbi:RidA family protein [Bacillus sp. EB600]|uniref:RidA family protein n=1 Tax=Bacillus sp. EB600 TaxID=2806345 RepID=UPI00210892E9|nr:RidA family protein [Bacillus sp. EB600]MCQ6280647.1 RidA family protein [Bacillus sp. EB600]